MSKMTSTVVVYCASSAEIDDVYMDAAARLGSCWQTMLSCALTGLGSRD